MKSIYSKVIISPLYIIGALLALFTGNFKMFTVITIIILVHESGHILASIYFKWNIEAIVIMPFSGLIKFNEKINRPLKEQFIICIMGPIFQVIFWLLLKRYDIYNFELYNKLLLSFNLLPINILDGSKLLNVFFNVFLPFKKSYFLIDIVSLISIVVLCMYSIIINSKLVVFLCLFFLVKTIKDMKLFSLVFYKFLLERIMIDLNGLKINIIEEVNINKIRINRLNYFLDNGVFVNERDLLRKKIFLDH